MNIPRRVKEYIKTAHDTPKAFISYIDVKNNRLSLRTFAFKKKGDKHLVTEVMRETLNKKSVKNIYFVHIGGYIPVYEKKDKTTSNYGYRYVMFNNDDFDKWYKVPQNEFNMTSRIINLEALADTKYKYCGYTSEWNEKGSFMAHLKKFSADPKVELLGKLGFNNPTQRLISKCEKDKQFVRFLYDNSSSARFHSVNVLIEAYKRGTTDFKSVEKELSDKRYITRQINNPYFTKSKISRTAAIEFITKNHIYPKTYGDYIEAISELGLDLTDTKNTFPKDFKRMHDLRIDEYDVLKMKKDKEKNKKLWQDFETVSNKNDKYRWECESYVVIMPHTIEDLRKEGKALNHCVGKMGYEKKVIDGRSLIGFFRAKDNPDKAFITVELDGKTASIKQAHTKGNGTPKANEQVFIEQWASFVKEQMKSLQIAK